MRRFYALQFGAALLAAVCASCLEVAPATDTPVANRDAGLDAGPDAGTDAGCQPGCHWNCGSGGTSCENGVVFFLKEGPVPCCQPWDHDRRTVCFTQDVALRCDSATCQIPDERYSRCIPRRVVQDSRTDHLFALYCAPPRRSGDACRTDVDCRPAAGTGRLACDAATGTCGIAKRPAAPANYGASCGVVGVEPYGDDVRAGVTCDLCHLAWDTDARCLRQGCTLGCEFDEDCPEGSVCVCAGAWQPRQICARVQGERFDLEARTAALKCW